MVKNFCKVAILGSVGKDPEIRSTASGVTVANFTIATSERIKGRGGQYIDKTEWHSLVAFHRTAEIVRDYVKKGDRLYIDGRLQTSSWDDKATGQKKYRTEIIVSDVSLLSGKAGIFENGKSEGSASSNKSRTDGLEITDDDIPW